jgi:hypothetical protein
VIAVAVAGGIVAYFGLRGGGKTAEPAASTPAAAPQVQQAGPIATVPPATNDIPAQPTGPSPTAVASELDRALKKQRLWGTVEVIGLRVDVRSGACSDPGMGPLLDSAREPLHRAGLTKLRCLEPSGRVVFERDL